MSDQFDQQANHVLPCICLPDYKDRSLTQPDCPRCNYGEDVADLLRKADQARYARGVRPTETGGDVAFEAYQQWTAQADMLDVHLSLNAFRAGYAAGYAARGEKDLKAVEDATLAHGWCSSCDAIAERIRGGE